MTVTGLHHLTAISSDPSQTYDFYTRVLGLRLVKKSVNQDDVGTYHLFFGNEVGSPGMDLTFFPFQPVRQGRHGTQSVERIGLAVPAGSLTFWRDRFAELGVDQEKIGERLGRSTLAFSDPDGQRFELVEATKFAPEFQDHVWTAAGISADQAVHCFPWMTLNVEQLEFIEPVLRLMGYQEVDEEGNQLLFSLKGVESIGELLVSVGDQTPAQMGAGTVHHLALGVKDESELKVFQERLQKIGLRPTAVIDRYYFKSVYFGTAAGLFELATLGPGFTADEDLDQLGEKLALPPFLESQRAEIEANLPLLESQTND